MTLLLLLPLPSLLLLVVVMVVVVSSSGSSSNNNNSPGVKKFVNHTFVMKFLPKWVLQYPEIQLCYSWLSRRRVTPSVWHTTEMESLLFYRQSKVTTLGCQ